MWWKLIVIFWFGFVFFNSVVNWLRLFIGVLLMVLMVLLVCSLFIDGFGFMIEVMVIVFGYFRYFRVVYLVVVLECLKLVVLLFLIFFCDLFGG